LIAFFSVGILALLRGRLFCNTICPVGSLLGLLSKFSVFKVILDDSQCTSCGLCEKACKSQCINSKEKTIDHSRCVTCFNCLDRCNKKGVKYRYAYNLAKKSAPLVEKLPVTDNEKGMNRRSFIVTSTAMAATVPFIPAWAQAGKEIDATKLTPITPPGSRSLKHFTEHCTACHLCITHCPAQVLKPAGFTFGFNYVFKPYLSYSIEHYCNYECTVCSEVCPNNAIGRLTVDEKKVVQVGIAQFTQERCVVYTDHTSCGACAEHCPVKAVSMEPYIDNLTLPHMYPELCIGCGGCESICPVRPIRAINVMANSVHQLAQRPKEEEMKEINSEELDFGF
jgi:ferredoxin